MEVTSELPKGCRIQLSWYDDRLAQQSANQHRRVGAVEAGHGVHASDEPAVKCLTRART